MTEREVPTTLLLTSAERKLLVSLVAAGVTAGCATKDQTILRDYVAYECARADRAQRMQVDF